MKLSSHSNGIKVSAYAFSRSKRCFDFLIALIVLIVVVIPMVLVAIAVRISSPGPILFKSLRVGRANKTFTMLKFRTMLVGTPIVATDQLDMPVRWLTPIGGFLRKSSLDELPQIINVLTGEMSLVGPRPALPTQEELIARRTDVGVQQMLPGITGLAQINGRDELGVEDKTHFDHLYLKDASFIYDIRILICTFSRVFSGKGVRH